MTKELLDSYKAFKRFVKEEYIPIDEQSTKDIFIYFQNCAEQEIEEAERRMKDKALLAIEEILESYRNDRVGEEIKQSIQSL